LKAKACIIGFLVLSLIFLAGCDGDGGQTVQDTSTDTEDTDEVTQPEIVLDSGSMSVSGSGERMLSKVFPPAAGTLQAALIWDPPPDELTLYFFCFDTLTEYPLETGGSPLILEQHVSEPWQEWILYLWSGEAANVSYVVMFQPD
jgi:hypothetical protein